MWKKLFPLVLVLVIVCVLFPDMAFAAEKAATQAKEVSERYSELLQILSWVWIVPATVAGKLMTNEFVYGEVFGMTTILWKLRQVMRMFAYMVLGFVFVALIIKHIIVLDEGSKVFDTLKKTFLAGILIQMTWFIMAVLIDLSIIVTAAMGSIPLQVMQHQWSQMKYQVSIPIVNINADTGKPLKIETEFEEKEFTLKEIMPSSDSVAGPLVFMGAGILRLMDMSSIEGGLNDGGEGDSTNYSALAVGGGLKLFITFLFVIPMLLLAVINMIRIFWIWVWIIVSPFLVIDIAFNGPLQKGEYADKFKPSVILGLIFQPVVIVGLLSLGLVMIVGIFDSLLGGEEHERESLKVLQVYLQDDNVAQVGTGIVSETRIVGELFKDLGGSIGGFVGEMILAFFVIFLLFALLKAGATFSKITENLANKSFKFMKDGAMAIPLPGIGSIGSVSKGISHVKNKVRSYQEQGYNEQADKQLEKVYEMFHIDQDDVKGGIDKKDITSLEAIIDNNKGTREQVTKEFFGELYNLSKKPDKTITYKGDVKRLINKWFEKQGKEYLKRPLGLDGKATIDSEQVKKFINHAMTKGKHLDPLSSQNASPNLTSLTSWGGKKK